MHSLHLLNNFQTSELLFTSLSEIGRMNALVYSLSCDGVTAFSVGVRQKRAERECVSEREEKRRYRPYLKAKNHPAIPNGTKKSGNAYQLSSL
ncbi:MAG: hypothetical protein ICV54_22990 [Nostoc sp. C3-bin3]|nr:hypothetical protein [Nostoc sp. C3-bin3]